MRKILSVAVSEKISPTVQFWHGVIERAKIFAKGAAPLAQDYSEFKSEQVFLNRCEFLPADVEGVNPKTPPLILILNGPFEHRRLSMEKERSKSEQNSPPSPKVAEDDAVCCTCFCIIFRKPCYSAKAVEEPKDLPPKAPAATHMRSQSSARSDEVSAIRVDEVKAGGDVNGGRYVMFGVQVEDESHESKTFVRGSSTWHNAKDGRPCLGGEMVFEEYLRGSGKSLKISQAAYRLTNLNQRAVMHLNADLSVGGSEDKAGTLIHQSRKAIEFSRQFLSHSDDTVTLGSTPRSTFKKALRTAVVTLVRGEQGPALGEAERALQRARSGLLSDLGEGAATNSVNHNVSSADLLHQGASPLPRARSSEFSAKPPLAPRRVLSQAYVSKTPVGS